MATRNRYAEIMAQYAQSQPFSFTGVPSGGFNPYASDYTGGFTPYHPPIPAPALPVQQDQYAGLIQQLTGGGGGGGGYSNSPEARAEREAFFNNMTDAGKEAHIATNQSIAKGLGFLGRLVVPFGFLGSNDNEGQNSTGGPSRITSPAAANAERAMQEAITAANAEGAGLTANPMSRDPSQGGGGGRSEIGGGYSNANAGNYGWTRSGGGEGGGWAQGGHVSMTHLLGPDPAGPDDGYGALKDGEYVINDKAVKKYGIELMNAINSGKISKGKLRGLLEM